MSKYYTYCFYINGASSDLIQFRVEQNKIYVPFVAEAMEEIYDEEEFGNNPDELDALNKDSNGNYILRDIVTGKVIYHQGIERTNEDNVLRYAAKKEINAIGMARNLKILENSEFLNLYTKMVTKIEEKSVAEFFKEELKRQQEKQQEQNAINFINEFKRRRKIKEN